MTRKALALAADVSERHLANLEYGIGNASILVLQQVAQALQCSLAELVGDVDDVVARMAADPRAAASAATSRRCAARAWRSASCSAPAAATPARAAAHRADRPARRRQVDARAACWPRTSAFPFVELSREIEQFAGCSIREIQALYGTNAYRRYERRALEEAIQIYPEAVIATPGGLVSEPATFNLLLAHCTTVWLQADPEEHMQRVVAQGDLRPMAASTRGDGRPAAHPGRPRRRSMRRPTSTLDTSGAAAASATLRRRCARWCARRCELPREHRSERTNACSSA